MRKMILLIGGAATVLSGCSSPEWVRACATTTTVPPIVRPVEECDQGFGGVRFYTAPAAEIDEDDLPIVGERLDSDWYHTWTTPQAPPKPAVKTPKAPTPRVAAPKARPVAPRVAAPAPRVSAPTVRTGK